MKLISCDRCWREIVHCILLIWIVCFFVCCFKAKQCGTAQLDEDGLFELVKTKPGKKISYEPSNKEKKTKKKEKTEEGKNWSQGKEELEGESSQLSVQSVSSPATQTPTSSPASKGMLWCSTKYLYPFPPPTTGFLRVMETWKTWCFMKFYNFLFQSWKVLKLKCGSWKSNK